MPRYIDADVLLKEEKKHLYYHLKNGDVAIPIIDIEHAQIVDAIPISQLEEWQKQYGNKCTYGHIMSLVNDWRKENEID